MLPDSQARPSSRRHRCAALRPALSPPPLCSSAGLQTAARENVVYLARALASRSNKPSPTRSRQPQLESPPTRRRLTRRAVSSRRLGGLASRTLFLELVCSLRATSRSLVSQ